jgi:imidazolonepropionase
MFATTASVLVDTTVATMARGADDTGYGLVRDAALVLDDGRVAWLGPRDELPEPWRRAEPRSLGGALTTPGLVECHAHLLFADDRPGGAPRADGGVAATVAATARCRDDDLVAATLRRARWFVRQGVTTLELKTGYGVEPEAELRLLRIAARVRAALPVRTSITLLAGHVYPPDADPDEYLLRVCDELLPAAIEQGAIDQVEVYCDETDGITMEHASTILETVYRRKIPTRVSADRISDSAGGALAPAFYSKLAAHLNHTDDIAVKAMGRAGTVAVLLPGALLELGTAGQAPPVDLLREQGVPIAVSTGFEPDTSPLADLRAAAHLGRTLLGLTPAEALHGITSVPGRALSFADAGTLAVGGRADLAVWDAEHPEDLVHWLGAPTCRSVLAAGQPVGGAW